MKITCTQENLNQGLNITGHLVNKSVNLPILNNLLIEAKEGQIKLLSTNLEIGISTLIRGKIEQQGVFTVDSKLLADYVSLLPKDNVEMELVKDDFLNVKCKNNNTRIKGIPADDFPVIPEIEKKDPFVVSIKELKMAISQVLFAVSNNDTRPEISGVLMAFGDNKLILVGTDSYRLAEKKISASGSSKQMQVIVPLKTLQELLRILSAMKEDSELENLDIYISDNQILFVIDGIEMISRLVEGNYPDYKQIIPTDAKTKTEVNTNEFVKIIKTTALFSKVGIFDIKLEFLPENKSIVVSSNNIQVGESVSELEVGFSGEKNNTTLNYRFLLDGLSNIGSSEITLDVIDNNVPCVMKPKGDDSYLYIIMPIKQ